MLNLKNKFLQNYYSKTPFSFSFILKKRGGDASGNFKNKMEINPVYYWKIIIFVFSFAVLFSLLANFLFFWYLNRVEILGKSDETTIKNGVQKKDLFEIVDKLNQKQAVFQELLNEKTDIQEP